jgi:hypothetical protein
MSAEPFRLSSEPGPAVRAVIRVRKAPGCAAYEVYEIQRGTQRLLAAFRSREFANAFAELRRAMLEAIKETKA